MAASTLPASGSLAPRAPSPGVAPRGKPARSASRALAAPPASKRPRVHHPPGDLASPRSAIATRAKVADPADASTPATPTTSAIDAASIPVVSAAEVHARLAAAAHPRALDAFAAFYSSWTNCITTDPRAMVLPFDDHMVHRGHGVFDTAYVHEGRAYQLDRHLDRFIRSTESAKIPLLLLPRDDDDASEDDDAPRGGGYAGTSPRVFDRDSLRAIILRTVAASGLRHAQVRFYAGAGPGGFALSQAECVRPTFYVVVTKCRAGPDPRVGAAVVTSPVPIKPPPFATVKSVNYLPNALVIEHARENRAEYGLWLTETGDVGEGPSMNVAFVTADGETLVTPPTSDVLAGCTMARAAELANEGKLASVGIARAEARRVPLEEARAAREAMLVGSVINCVPIVEWDGVKVGGNERGTVDDEQGKGAKEGEDAKEGDEGEGPMRSATASGAAPPHAAGTPGPVALALHDLLVRDFETNEAELVDVPYELFEDERSDE